MAYYNVCSSPSSLFHDLQLLSTPISLSSRTKQRNSTYSYKPKSLNLRSKSYLYITNVSLQDSVLQENHEKNGNENSTLKYSDGDSTNSSKKSKNFVWVNPKSPKASELRKKTYDSRYASLLKLAESLDSCNPDEKDVLLVFEKGFSGKLYEHDAVVIINKMSNPKTAVIALKYFLEKLKPAKKVILYNVTMKVFRKCKDLGSAEKLFDEMIERGVKPDQVTFSTMISCYRLASLPKKAVEWFEKMPSFGCEPDEYTYSAAIDAYGRAGDLDMAFKLYDRTRTEKWRIDPGTFATLIRIYGVAGNFDGCLNVFEEMKAIGVKPNLVLYNTLLDAMGRAKRPWQAKIFYNDLITNGFTPNSVTYAALLRAYGRARYGEDALYVYREMKEKGMELNVILYNTILAMCADIGYVDEAVEIFDDLKRSACKPDSWTFSSMITVYSCGGKVQEAEGVLNEMIEEGYEPNIFVLTSLIQCYGKSQRTDDVVRTFNRVIELGITPDDRFCGCLLNVMTQTPKEELVKLIDCTEKAKPKLGRVVKLLVEEQNEEGVFKKEAYELFDSLSTDVRKAHCNCLIDLCVNLNLLEKACELLELGLSLEIYSDLQSRTATQWSLHLKSLSLGAALTALHVWINDLSKALESGEELPPLLAINTGHGKHKFSDKGLAAVLESHLKELNTPFHEAPDQVGWFLTTKVAAKSWLESRNAPELVSV